MGRTAGPTIKDDKQYEALRRQGMSKEKAARIANSGSRSKTGRKGGKAQAYEEWTRDELYQQAKKVGIERPVEDVEGRTDFLPASSLTLARASSTRAARPARLTGADRAPALGAPGGPHSL